ncbi:hypothetical protein PybrP1_003800, partial [[Pythium] brassicae (nom. inval.)]
YVNEIAPPHLRGTLGGGLQISISLGTLLVVCTFFFANTSAGWRYIAGFQILWGALFLGLASFLLVESPAWLLMTAKRDEAAAVMARIYGEENVSLAFTWFEPQVALSDIESPRVESEARNSIEVVQKTQSTASQLVSSIFRRQLIIAIGIASAQQLSGISAVFYYSSSLFKDAGISDDRVGSLIINIMNLLPPFTTGYFANRFGYRRIILFGFLGMLVSAVGITIAFIADVAELSIVFTGAYVAVYAMSLGPLVYVVTADLFPDTVRGTAVSICIFFNWLSNLLTGITFPYIADALEDFGFLPFIATLAFFYFFTLRLIKMLLTEAKYRVAKFRSGATNPIAVRMVITSSSPLQWMLKLAVAMLLFLYFLSSASILVYWNDVAGKTDGKASIAARHEADDTLSATAAGGTRLNGAGDNDSGVRDPSAAAAEMSYPKADWKGNEFQCLGWVETDEDGGELGRRECWQRVRGGESGFCEVLNTTSGELFRVMRTTHLSLKDDVRFTCQLAKEFTSFRNLAASIRLLRAKGSRLPIELWFRHDELRRDNPVLQALVDDFGPVSLRLIHDERIEGFYVKAHALYYSRFDRALLLDADNFALQDPTPLFSAEPFKRVGAVFWPDFWHPGNTIFNQEFIFVNKRMPGSLGVVNPERQRFCGMSMVHGSSLHDECP